MGTRAFIEKAMAHLPALLRMGRRLTKDRAEAEDLVQETLVRAMEKRGELRDEKRMNAWLLAIQKSVHLNSRRGLRHRLELLQGGLSESPREPTGDLAEEVTAGSLTDELHRALEKLPPEWRETLWLREVEELTYEEIAEVQRCPVGTVRSRLARARARMIELLEVPRHGCL